MRAAPFFYPWKEGAMAYKVAVIVGSIRAESLNKKLAHAVTKLAGDRIDCNFIDIAGLPLFSQDLEANTPEPVRKLKSEIEAAQALWFFTPEYNRGVPGVLKNAIDWGSRPYGKNSFAGKPAAVAGASVGTIGTAIAQQQLRNSLAYLDVPTLGQPEVFVHAKDGTFDANGNLASEGTKQFLQGYADKYVAWLDKFLK
jgi:chromate reductase